MCVAVGFDWVRVRVRLWLLNKCSKLFLYSFLQLIYLSFDNVFNFIVSFISVCSLAYSSLCYFLSVTIVYSYRLQISYRLVWESKREILG